jgi:Putative transposase/Transposase zinc-binding domain
MIRLSSIINTFEAELLAQYGSRLLPGHQRALNAMKHCRTAMSPHMQLQCAQCERHRLVPHSCSHRHCPHCQHHESQQWLERQLRQLVPGCYFLLTCKCVGSGAKTPVYLGRYLYRGVIREKDILACKDGQVTFRYQDGKSQRWQTRTVPGATFLWLLLQHVLPKGLRRARSFGFLHPNSKRLRSRLASLAQSSLIR